MKKIALFVALFLLVGCGPYVEILPPVNSTPYYERNKAYLSEQLKKDLCYPDAAYVVSNKGWRLAGSDMPSYEGISLKNLDVRYNLLSAEQVDKLNEQFVRIESNYPEGMVIGGVQSDEIHRINGWCE